MMTFQAKVLVDGEGEGSVLVLPEPLSLWGGLDPHTGEVIDQRHPCAGENVAGRVLILPSGRGSSSASNILLQAVKEKTAPAAIILQVTDGILALGVVVARELYGQAPPVLVLGDRDYGQISREADFPGVMVHVKPGGIVSVMRPGHDP